MKRSKILLLAVALVSTIGLFPAYAQDNTLTLFMPNDNNMAAFNAVADAFQKKTGIKVTFDLRPGGPEGENMVKTRLATSEMDDMVFYNSGSLFQALNPSKNFVDLSGEAFMGQVLESYKSTVSVGSQVYMIPAQTVMGGGWYYNKKIYAQLGLKVPKTWSELVANLEKIKAAKITPVAASFKDAWTSQLVILADYYNVQSAVPRFADSYTNHKATFAETPAALRGFEKLAELGKKGYFNKDAATTTFDMAQKMLLDGKAANYPMLTFATSAMATLDPVKIMDIGYFAQPGDTTGSNGLTIWMPSGIAIYKGSKNIDAAKKFLAFYVSPEGLALNMAAQKPEGPFAIKGVKLPDDILPATKDLLPYIDSGKTAPALEFLSPIKGPNLPQICVQTGLGLKSALDNAKEYDKDVAKQAKQLGLTGW